MPVDKQEVQNFIQKVWKMVNAPTTDNLIHWNSETGKSFVITDQNEFAKHVLPLYFKHQNMPSFIRQLNMYGFRKVMNVDHMGMATANEEIEFMHQEFQKNHPDKLKLIKRKMSNKTEIASLKIDDVHDIYQEIEAIKNRQEMFHNFLMGIRNQNQALWKEIQIERQKHEQQQELLNKMFGFLVSIVKNKKVVFDQGVKRKAPMILHTNSSSQSKKAAKNTFEDRTFEATSPEAVGPQIFEICDESGSTLPQGSPMPDMAASTAGANSSAFQQQFQLPSTTQTAQVALSPSNINIQQPTMSQTSEDLLNLAMEELQNENFSDSNTVPDSSTSAIIGSNPTPITDLVLSNPNLSITPNYQGIQDHIDGMDTELDWLGDQIRNFTDFDYDPGMMELYKYDDMHEQEQQYQMNSIIADTSLDPSLQTPPKQPTDESTDVPWNDSQRPLNSVPLCDNLLAFDSLTTPDVGDADQMDTKFLDQFNLSEINDEETKKILATNDLDNDPKDF